jgi:nicotinate dehydrogenase subunit B
MKVATSLKTTGQTVMTPDALAALERAGFSRRDFLKGAGALVVGFRMTAGAGKLDAQTVTPVQPRPTTLNQVDSWVAIARDETVTGYSGKCDFGQGFATVQYQLIAEELSVPLERVRLIYCDTFLTPDQGVTSGSQSHMAEFGATGLRQALATAREALFQMASKQLEVGMDQLMVEDGVIRTMSGPSKQVSYGQLIGGKQLSLTLDSRAVPKDPSKYTILGTSLPRYDIPAKATGQYQYVQHVRVPGMLHGKVVRPPVVGAKVVKVDESSVKSLPGNVRVVVKNDFVGVVADKEWQAAQAAAILDVTWSEGVGLPNQQTFTITCGSSPPAIRIRCSTTIWIRCSSRQRAR